MRISDWSSDVCSSDLRQVDRGDVGLEGVLVEGRHHGRVVGHDRGVALGRRGAGRRAALGLDAVFLEQEGRGVGLAEGHGAGNAEREGGNLYEAGMGVHCWVSLRRQVRSEEHTSELQSLMRISYAVFCLNKKNTKN